MLKSAFNTGISFTPPTSDISGRQYGVVNNVILNDEDVDTVDLIPEMGIDDDTVHDKLTTYIGAIQVSTPNDGKVDETEFKIAFPYDRNSMKLPIINESVELIQLGGVLYYKLIDPTIIPSLSSDSRLLTAIKNPSEYGEPANDPISSYSSNSKTGIPNNIPILNKKKDERFGKYYEVQEDVHKLKLYEGDWLLESRFGQSIRFNGYDENKKFSPTIFIRNSENGISKTDKKIGELTVEDINRDGTTIVLSSEDRLLNFIPGTVSKSSTSDFKTEADSFRSYPNQLKGDQLLLSSGRLIFSARNGETILWSKKNVGIISDENFSFDLGKGIIGSLRNNIEITTNDSNIRLNTGSGKINLGEDNSGKELEWMVRGETLVELLEELIDTINGQSFATPSGPTSISPLNRIEFQGLKRRWREILSSQNKTI
jgi:hypothetical protein